MPWSDPRDLDIRGDICVMFCFLGWRTVADAVDALGGFARHVESWILDLAAEFVPWNDPVGLGVRGERGMFCFLGWRALILEVRDCGGCPGRPRRLYWTCRGRDTGSCSGVCAVEQPYGSGRAWGVWDVLFTGV